MKDFPAQLLSQVRAHSLRLLVVCLVQLETPDTGPLGLLGGVEELLKNGGITLDADRSVGTGGDLSAGETDDGVAEVALAAEERLVEYAVPAVWKVR